jgi:hypothetical protein
VETEARYARGVAGIQTLQGEALKRADDWLADAMEESDPRRIADFALAAKNAASVAVSCESILKMRKGPSR